MRVIVQRIERLTNIHEDEREQFMRGVAFAINQVETKLEHPGVPVMYRGPGRRRYLGTLHQAEYKNGRLEADLISSGNKTITVEEIKAAGLEVVDGIL